MLHEHFLGADEQSLVRLSRDKLPGHVLPMSLKNIWEVIKDQKDLNLPAHKVCNSLSILSSSAGMSSEQGGAWRRGACR